MPAIPRSQTGPGRPKDPGKRRAILEAAKQLFPRQGYDATSMDAIAAEAGVSKLTVYSHFKDKESLFSAAVTARCEEQLPHETFELGPDSGPIRERLLEIGLRCHALVSSEEALQLHRIMAARAPHDVRLAQLFFEAGPKRLLGEFQVLLERACAAGVLRVDDPRVAAEHFFCLVKGLAHMQVLIGARAPLTTDQARSHVESVVELFLRAHGPDPGHP
jgi:TetR/AcrR family transcriptional regulator, mexJK operon transcriptional repressor